MMPASHGPCLPVVGSRNCATLSPARFMHFDVYGHFHFVPFYGNGYLFVDFFFVLSGFVISANYQHRLLRLFGIGHFMLLRFGRLYPLHVFMLACFIVFELIHSIISLDHPISPRLLMHMPPG